MIYSEVEACHKMYKYLSRLGSARLSTTGLERAGVQHNTKTGAINKDAMKRQGKIVIFSVTAAVSRAQH